MARARRRRIIERKGTASGQDLQPHQLAAVAAPRLPTARLAGQERQKRRGAKLKKAVKGPPARSPGNFEDLDSLLEHLGSAPVMAFGKPPPEEPDRPAPRVGSNPAAHNRVLLDEQPD